VATLVLVVLPGHDNYTHAGKVDHHVIEPLLTFAAVACLSRAAAVAKAGEQWLWALLCSATMLLALESWPSASLSILLLAGCAGVLVLADGDDARLRHRSTLVGVVALGAAGLLALPLAWLAPMGRLGATESAALSWFQPILLLLLAVALAAAGLATRAGLPGKALGIGVGCATFAVGLAVWPAGRASLLGGSDFMEGGGYVVLINESIGVAEKGLAETLRFFSPVVALIPLLLAWALWSHKQSRNPQLLVLAASLAATSVLAWQQVRFVMLLAVPLAVLAGAGFAALLNTVQRHGIRVVALAVLASLALLMPAVHTLATSSVPVARRVPVWRALRWMAAATPSAGDPWQDGSRPSYAVMAPWGFGHEVLVLGQRANVASPFIQPHETEGLDAALRFALTADPSVAEGILARHHARYVLTVPLALAATDAYAQALRQPPRRYVLGDDATGRTLTLEGQQSGAVVLAQRHGSAEPQGGKSWNFLRLILSANGYAKIFEKVAGARLEVQGWPAGASATLEIDLDVEGQGWKWLSHARADAGGRFQLRVPYATDVQGNGNVRVLAAVLRGKRVEQSVAVPNKAVVEGLTVAVSQAAVPPR